MKLYAILAAKSKARRQSIADNEAIYLELYHKNSRVGYISFTGDAVIVNDTTIRLHSTAH